MNFDAVAPHYRWLEAVSAGSLLQQCRTEFLPQLNAPRNILIIGDGNGRFLAECRKRFPDATIVSVDSSAAMLNLAKQRLARSRLSDEHVQFIQGDILQWNAPADTFDLIVTHFVLDCFRAEQLAQLIPRLAAAAKRDASWLLADFRVPDRGAQRYRSRLILWLLYRFFRLTARLHASELTPPDGFLEATGFRLRERHLVDFGLLHSDWWVRDSNRKERRERRDEI